MGSGRVTYLDFAATTALRPPAVAGAIAAYIGAVGATPGRGAHRLANEAGRIALRCRQSLARLLGLPGDPGRIAFMLNATHALNTALWGLLRARDRVVATQYDHNAVLRPLHRLAHDRAVDITLLDGAPDGSLDAIALERALDGARLLVINAASNVLGTTLDVAALVRAAHAAGAYALVDAAQSAGHVPFDAAAAGADLVAITGHKALLGPQGVGALWVRDGVDLDPLLTGGTGGDSSQRDMPRAYPDHLEAGTLPGPAIAGLLAGLDWLHEEGVGSLHARTAALKRRLWHGLQELPGVRVRSPLEPESAVGGATGGVPVVTITADSVDPATLAARLDRDHGVLTRAGLHCAPEAHRLLGTIHTGAVRFSLGWCTTAEDVELAVRAVHDVTA